MKLKAGLIDFDGTLVTKDILDVACGIVGKEQESQRINQEFQSGKRKGLSGLIERINLLKGVSFNQIKEKLDNNDYLMPGAKDLFKYFREQGIITIIRSANMEPILKYYQKKLGADYIIGAKPKMRGNLIDSVSEDDFSSPEFKLEEAKKILKKLGIAPDNVIAIGDSMGDKTTFNFAAKSIAINPKGEIERYADFVIKDDLAKAIPFIENNCQ